MPALFNCQVIINYYDAKTLNTAYPSDESLLNAKYSFLWRFNDFLCERIYQVLPFTDVYSQITFNETILQYNVFSKGDEFYNMYCY